ncbi:GntR family transcriptional regulator [Alcaligenaceae bacterium]|nr:GntR family transcriptional regulator [Alcaligenaceae bacterium]
MHLNSDSEQVYRTVRDHVLDLVKRIDEPVRIREQELAEKLGVSRTPVRQALLRLGQDGILSLEPRKGAILAPTTTRDYIEWLKLRVELEGFAAREAALNASKRDVDALRAIFAGYNDDTLDQDDKAAGYAAANVEFHAALMSLADNRLLERIWGSFGHRGMLRTRTIARLHRASQSLREHLAMIDAIERRDAALAERLAREHVEGLLNQVTHELENKENP